MKRELLIFCAAMLGCVPKPVPVEAPATIFIEPIGKAPVPTTSEPTPRYRIVWNVYNYYGALEPETNDKTRVYKIDDEHYITASLDKDSVILECSSGASGVFKCNRDGAAFTFGYYQIVLNFECKYESTDQKKEEADGERNQTFGQ